MFDQSKIDDFLFRSENISKISDKDIAFKIISSEINTCDDRYLHEYIGALNYIRYEKVLDWIEDNSKRISRVNGSWGHLAASSHFNWERAEKWLFIGRPLSLIALDALLLCTTIGERLNQSEWMRHIQPRLNADIQSDLLAKRLQEYLLIDNVPRTKSAVQKIINNIFEIEE